MKWVPLMVVSSGFGQVRTSAHGSALMNGLGTSASANHLPQSWTTETTSAGRPSIGMLRGHDNVERRSAPG
jgi:hypothetical protein